MKMMIKEFALKIDGRFPNTKPILRWLPFLLLVLGIMVEIGAIKLAIYKELDFLYIGIAFILGVALFTPPPILSLAGFIIEDRKTFKAVHICTAVVGTILFVSFCLLTSALVNKVAFVTLQRWMHGL